eukprot:4421436-Amphidinium_carterae.3
MPPTARPQSTVLTNRPGRLLAPCAAPNGYCILAPMPVPPLVPPAVRTASLRRHFRPVFSTEIWLCMASPQRWCSWIITTSGNKSSDSQAASWRRMVPQAVQLTDTTVQRSLRGCGLRWVWDWALLFCSAGARPRPDKCSHTLRMSEKSCWRRSKVSPIEATRVIKS